MKIVPLRVGRERVGEIWQMFEQQVAAGGYAVEFAVGDDAVTAVAADVDLVRDDCAALAFVGGTVPVVGAAVVFAPEVDAAAFAPEVDDAAAAFAPEVDAAAAAFAPVIVAVVAVESWRRQKRPEYVPFGIEKGFVWHCQLGFPAAPSNLSSLIQRPASAESGFDVDGGSLQGFETPRV
ncbi:hypothetical protein HDU93_001334 [Gonapodya sp. JEL0774]|nr:hypothetical protein HDU93_001334 [Gonapodya sp. JEL0774]